MEFVDLVLHSAGQLCTIDDRDGPQRGEKLGELGIITNGAVAVHDGCIEAVGLTAELVDRYKGRKTFDLGGRCLVPGFVDPHTHIPWYGDRASEFELRLTGASYMEIMASGGGIMSTVHQTRGASLEDLVKDNMARLTRMLSYGTTSAEAKTGYGLERKTELKQLEAIKELNQRQPVELAATFLPAHALPPEFDGRQEEYVELVIDEMLPAGADWMKANGVRLFCDVFCEEGAFDLEETKRILEAAAGLGYGLKVHADEFVGLGGAGVAIKLGAVSADHLVATPQEDIEALGKGGTVAVGLPGTPFGLSHKEYTPAKKILAANGILALASDLNPGTSWCESMQMVMALACRYMGLTQAQVLAAATLNGAYAIGRGENIGSLSKGKQADMLILDVDDYRQLGYRYGTNLVRTVIKKGEVVLDG